MNINGKRVLVTGGSSGIGLALAHAFLAKGAKVVITGRRPEALAKAVQELRENYSHVWSVAANVATADGRAATIRHALEALGGLDILVNNAGGVRAGRLENTPEAELQAMIDVDLVAPILLTRAVLPALRASGDAMVVNVSSGIALIGAPFYATYAATKAGLAHFGEALRRELKGEDVHVLTVYPGGTDTPMMKSNRAGPELGFAREPATAVADAVVQGIEANAFEVVRGGEARAQMVALNRTNPAAVDERFFATQTGSRKCREGPFGALSERTSLAVLARGHSKRERSVSRIGMDHQSARHGRSDLLSSGRGFHPRQRILEWHGRDPEIAAEWVAEGDNQDQHQDARDGQHSRHRKLHPQARGAKERTEGDRQCPADDQYEPNDARNGGLRGEQSLLSRVP